MEITTGQKDFLKYARRRKRESEPIQAKDVVYQLLEIANGKIGGVRAYWSDDLDELVKLLNAKKLKLVGKKLN